MRAVLRPEPSGHDPGIGIFQAEEAIDPRQLPIAVDNLLRCARGIVKMFWFCGALTEHRAFAYDERIGDTRETRTTPDAGEDIETAADTGRAGICHRLDAEPRRNIFRAPAGTGRFSARRRPGRINAHRDAEPHYWQ